MDAWKFVFLVVLPVIHFGGSFPLTGFALQYTPGKSYQYNYSTHTAFNEANVQPTTRGRKDVGITLDVVVDLMPVWNEGKQYLVKMQLSRPQISSVVKSGGREKSDLRNLAKHPIYFKWEEGQVSTVYATESDSILAVNFKKGIISLLQLRTEEGEALQVDVSGECSVTYKTEGDTVTKTKTQCLQLDKQGQFSSVNPLMGVEIAAKRETVYKLKDDIINTASSTEQITTVLPMKDSLTSSVSVRQELKLAGTGRGQTVQAPTIEDAVKKLSKGKDELFGMILVSVHEEQECTQNCGATKKQVARYRERLLQENVGSVETGTAVQELVEVFRSTSTETMLKILRDEENEKIIPVLVDILAAVQTQASQQTLMEFLDFEDENNIELPERYLLATAFVTHPTESLLKELLTLYRKNVASPKLRESIGEGLGAVAYTYCQVNDQCARPLIKEIQEAILEKLEECEDSCKAMHLRSLANAALPDTIPVLLKYAEESKNPTVSETAIKGLRRMDRKYFDEELLDIMRQIFHQEKRGYDTAVRTKALKFLLESWPDMEQLRRIFYETRDPWETEFDLYVQATLYNLAEQDSSVKQMLTEILKDESLRNYNILAPKGKSLAFTASLGETDSLLVPYFMYVENTRAGLLKRSGMDVTVNSSVQTLPMYSFGIFASGLEGLIGTAEEAQEQAEDVVATAGISLDLMDVSLRPITFFEGGVSSLLSAVWNAPADVTSALQTNILLHDHLERIHLQNGLVGEVKVQSSLSIDLSGSLQFSMWNKNSQSLVKNSGSLVLEGSSRLVSSTFKAGIDYTATSASKIDFETYVDFYDKVKMCLQMSHPEFVFRHHVKKYEHAHGFKNGYIAHIRRSQKVNGVSYPLPRRNNVVCRELMEQMSS